NLGDPSNLRQTADFVGAHQHQCVPFSSTRKKLLNSLSRTREQRLPFTDHRNHGERVHVLHLRDLRQRRETKITELQNQH
ncbi:sensory box/GGDEF family protein, partial [Vibrio parahaemolyticus AQ3810]